MLTYVLDASSIIRLIDKEAGWARVGELLEAAVANQVRVVISAVNWGEVVYTVAKCPDFDLKLKRSNTCYSVWNHNRSRNRRPRCCGRHAQT